MSRTEESEHTVGTLPNRCTLSLQRSKVFMEAIDNLWILFGTINWIMRYHWGSANGYVIKRRKTHLILKMRRLGKGIRGNTILADIEKLNDVEQIIYLYSNFVWIVFVVIWLKKRLHWSHWLDEKHREFECESLVQSERAQSFAQSIIGPVYIFFRTCNSEWAQLEHFWEFLMKKLIWYDMIAEILQDLFCFIVQRIKSYQPYFVSRIIDFSFEIMKTSSSESVLVSIFRPRISQNGNLIIFCRSFRLDPDLASRIATETEKVEMGNWKAHS